MGAFQEPIAREHARNSRFWLPESRIVAHSQAKFPSAARQKMPGDLLHQCVFIVEAIHLQPPSLPTCPSGQGTGSQALYQKKKNTGLTRQSTKTNMQGVANQGSRFRF